MDKTPNKNSDNTPKKIILDINTKKLDDILWLIKSKNYDFVVLQPLWKYVKISFRKDSKEVDVKNIKNEVFENLSSEIKKALKLDIKKYSEEVKSKKEYEFEKEVYELIVKIQPGQAWEIFFIKTKKLEKKAEEKNNTKKLSTSTILSVALAMLMIVLILWSAFITFVVFNAKTTTDVAFFKNLWINLNDINSFLANLSTILFSIILFVQLVLLVIVMFKAFLTKKEFKRKKLVNTFLSVFLLITTWITWTFWMAVDLQIKKLPNWQEMAMWALQLYDNNLLVSTSSKTQSVISDTSRLIWPMSLKIDVKNLSDQEKRGWFNITKFEWIIDWNSIDTLVPELIYDFNEKKTYSIQLNLHWFNQQWQSIVKPVDWMPSLNIAYLVNIREVPRQNGLKSYVFTAKELTALWELEWYLDWNTSQTPDFTWNTFIPSQPFSQQQYVGLRIKNTQTKWFRMDKIFVVGEKESDISAKIEANVAKNNHLQYTFSLSDIQTSLWGWLIEQVNWNIWGTVIKNTISDVIDPEKDSIITHIFDKSDEWEIEIEAELVNTAWEKYIISKTINIKKSLELLNQLSVYANWEKVKELDFNETTKEYKLQDLWSPLNLRIDARFIKPTNPDYNLKMVKWNIESTQNIQKLWKELVYEFKHPWDYKIFVDYVFENKTDSSDIVNVTESVLLYLEEKEYNLVLNITPETEYAPTNVMLDASESSVKWQNIVMYNFDFWDWWTQDSSDAVVSSRRYLKSWTYDVKLTVTTNEWNTYTTNKALVLKEKWNLAKITTSLKSAPVWQSISFKSSDSEGYILSSKWDFGDWKSSFETNPIHTFSKPWTYNVKLTLMFSWNVQLTDEMKIEIIQ